MQTRDMKFRLWNMVLVLSLMLGSIMITPALVQAQDSGNQIFLPAMIGEQTPELDLALLAEDLEPEISVAAEPRVYPFGCDYRGRKDWTDHCWASRKGGLHLTTGNYVKAIQTIVWCQGFAQGNLWNFADGNFDDETHHAVMAFQRANRISIDGIVGPQTWNMLQQKIKHTRNAVDNLYRVYDIKGNRCNGDYFAVTQRNLYGIEEGFWWFKPAYSHEWDYLNALSGR